MMADSDLLVTILCIAALLHALKTSRLAVLDIAEGKAEGVQCENDGIAMAIYTKRVLH